MCGIVGYVGDEEALPILLQKLNLLTYRGYDSAGIAVSHNGNFYVEKAQGKVGQLEQLIDYSIASGVVGLGHTRWATHGEPSRLNAHPHLDCSGRIALVHNGIVENFLSLRTQLEAEGHTFRSETDTEVLVHLVEKYYDGNVTKAVQLALQQVEGALAIVVLHKDEEDRLVAAKMDTPPLIIGLGRGENHVASDIPALLHYTNKVYVMEDGEVATITKNDVLITNFREAVQPRIYERRVMVIDWPPEVAQKGGYPHYMLKEIHEQPDTIEDTLRGRLLEDGHTDIPDLHVLPEEIRAVQRMTFVACGTAYHACLVAKHLFETVLRIPVQVDVGSEFRYRQPIIGPDEWVVAISQSGETADTIASMREGREQHAKVLAITNVVGSSVARLADGVIFTRAGPEIAVASTKAFVGQLIGVYLLLLHMAQFRPHAHADELQAMAGELPRLAGLVQRLLEDQAGVQDIAGRIAQQPACFFIGRNLDEPIALEGSLKLKEISYIQSQGYAAGELKHGTLALLEEGIPVICLATQPNVYDKMLSNVQEVMARRAWTIGLVPEGDTGSQHLMDDVLTVPRTHPWLSPVLAAVQVQLLAYHCANALERDIDQPRNLAKSVTVE
ncbi:MAG: glutamine--fructose-6-phosphate transaminase (isomerizing) [Chloroflexi bacterium]|nr:glutamine--fructose-6-phosphate transaminase (isomerizing) [Chloroflexota bacterium]